MAKAKSAEVLEGTKCPISKETFVRAAKPLLVTLAGGGAGDKQLVLGAKVFSTGSFGWHGGEKAIIVIDGVPVKVQVNMVLTVVGSKDQK